MPDDFANQETGLTSPAQDAGAVTPSDTVPLPRATRGVYLGTGGDLRVKMVSGTVVTFAAVPAGTFLPLRTQQIYATGTTAGNIVGLR
jgi:hypothetical protein